MLLIKYVPTHVLIKRWKDFKIWECLKKLLKLDLFDNLNGVMISELVGLETVMRHFVYVI